MRQSDPREIFREEARELLAQLESAILAMEERPDAAEAIDQVFRTAHTLKGSGAMAGFDSVAEMAHELESAFDLVRSGHLTVSSDLISLTLWIADFIRNAVFATTDDDAAGRQRVRALISTLKDISRIAHDSPPVSAPAPRSLSGAPELFLVRFQPGRAIFMRGLQPERLVASCAELGETLVVARLAGIPPLDEFHPEECYVGWDLLLATEQGHEAIRDLFVFVEDDSQIDIHPLVGRRGFAGLDRDAWRSLLREQAHLPARELAEQLYSGPLPVDTALATAGQVAPSVASPSRSLAVGAATASAAPALVGETENSAPDEERVAYVRVRADRLDALVNLVGELVVLQGRLATSAVRLGDSDLKGINEEAERLTLSLRRNVLRTRMLPIGSTFSRFQRLVRDLGQQTGKEVELATVGEKTELDKTMLDQLQEPLVHLVRNCVDHGIEPPGQRLQAGKPARGQVRLVAEQRGANVVIEIADDGAGLDLERIRAKAVAMGVIPAEAALAGREVADLIFHPGLSTAAAVTSLSGRGVGMDAVRETVQGLRGTVEVESQAGQGARFTIKLPLTLAIVDGLLVQVGAVRYVIPLAEIKECVELRQGGALRNKGRNLVMLRQEVVPFVRLRELFATPGDPPAIEQVVIVQVGTQRVGFAVDQVIGEHQTVLKGLGRLCRQVPGVSGATILGDGGVALTLDVKRLLALARAQESSKRHAAIVGAWPGTEACAPG